MIPLLLLVVGGCSGVTSQHLVGKNALVLDADDWEGTWIDTESALSLAVRDAQQGIIELAWVDDEDGRFQLHTMTCQLMEGDDWLFWNVLTSDHEDLHGEYLWGRFDKNEREIIMWFPAAGEFREVVEQEHLTGYIEESQPEEHTPPKKAVLSGYIVRLQETSERLVEFIESPQHCSLLNWEEPTILRKVGK